MTRYIVRRLIWSVFVVFAASFVVFFVTYLSGDPVALMVPPEGAVSTTGAPITTGTTFAKPGPRTSWTVSPMASLGCSTDPGTAAATVRACSRTFGPHWRSNWAFTTSPT